MNAGNVRDISEILTSIEALNQEAARLNRADEHEENGSECESLPASLVAKMNLPKADVVLLDDVYRKGTSQQESKANCSGFAAEEKTKFRPTPEFKDSSSDIEFDQMLSALMKDMELQSKKVDTESAPRLSATTLKGANESDELTNLKADIDDLLSPYLNKPASLSKSEPLPVSKFSCHQKSEKEGQSQQLVWQKNLSNESLLSVILTDDMRAEIAEHILTEIKLQISGWIAENLENIVEDALRSLSTEARDALKARSVRL